ncbi:hypothetical protein F5Y15DRAFT_412857 [Xylariaceae sp. FL0016]|nr:hypothetical protein F5Y15DRAFT_412857 [Xylariaceae sp. FL0016]
MSNMTNPLATPTQLFRRTNFSALPPDLQDSIFFASAALTQSAGLLLRLPQSVTAQANIILARYWLIEPPLSQPSPKPFEPADVSAAALFLVAKLSAHPAPPRDLCNVYAYLQSPSSPFLRAGSSSAAEDLKPDPQSYYLSETAYALAHARILHIESRVAYALSFDTRAALPHPLAVTYLQALDFLDARVPRRALAQRTLAHLNAALLSPQLLCLTHQPNALAVAAIYNAARDVGARAPPCAWWEVFDVDREELGFLVVGMRSVEGWARKQREAFAELGKGMITVAHVEEEMRRRGLRFEGGGHGNGEVQLSEEEVMMRSMDEKAEMMEQ